MTRSTRILLAPDKFKGSLSALEVASILDSALTSTCPDLDVRQHPIADGGEGTVALALTQGFTPVKATVSGPLGGLVEATYAVRDDVAIIEMSSAAGLSLLPQGPTATTSLASTTYGVGELILAAASAGMRRIVVGVGGSATTDGGAGALAALGMDLEALRSGHTDTVPWIGDAHRVLAGVELVVACDVDNPLLGPSGAAATYAPQKGAGPTEVAALEARLEGWADEVARVAPDLRDTPGAGAAGGLAYGLASLAGARILSGIDLILDLTNFDAAARSADLIIVGEGSLDAQSLRGKGPVGVAKAAAEMGTPVIAVAGRNLLSREEWHSAGLRAVYALNDVEPDPQVCMRDASRLLASLAQDIAVDWIPEAEPSHDETSPTPSGQTLSAPRPPTASEYRRAMLSTVDQVDE